MRRVTFLNQAGENPTVQYDFFLSVLNFTGLFTNVVAKWPGSTHDSDIFGTSALGRQLEEGGGHGLAEGLLLGDSDYACSRPQINPLYN